MSTPHTYEQIEEAIRKAPKGGKYRLHLQRIIDGHKCRAYARVVTLDGTQYWNIDYQVIGLCDVHSRVMKMFDIISEKIDKMKEKAHIVLWRY